MSGLGIGDGRVDQGVVLLHQGLAGFQVLAILVVADQFLVILQGLEQILLGAFDALFHRRPLLFRAEEKHQHLGAQAQEIGFHAGHLADAGDGILVGILQVGIDGPHLFQAETADHDEAGHRQQDEEGEAFGDRHFYPFSNQTMQYGYNLSHITCDEDRDYVRFLPDRTLTFPVMPPSPQTTPRFCRRCHSSTVTPNSARMAWPCSPGAGAGRTGSAGMSERRTGGPYWVMPSA